MNFMVFLLTLNFLVCTNLSNGNLNLGDGVSYAPFFTLFTVDSKTFFTVSVTNLA